MGHAGKRSVRGVGVVLLVLAATGCSDKSGGGGGGAPVGPDVGGKDWVGIYFVEGQGNLEAITAKIKHSGDSVKITTTKAAPPGKRFTGTMRPNGFMVMTDASDGERWTTHEHLATTNFVELEDFIRQPQSDEDADTVPKKIVRLER